MLVLGFLTATSAFLVLVFVEPGGSGQPGKRASNGHGGDGEQAGHSHGADPHRLPLLSVTEHQQHV